MATRLHFHGTKTYPGAPQTYQDVLRADSLNLPWGSFEMMDEVNGERPYAHWAAMSLAVAHISERAAAEFTLSGEVSFRIPTFVDTGMTVKLRARLSKITAGGSHIETPILTVDTPSNISATGARTFETFAGTPPVPVVVAPNERLVVRFSALPGDGSSYGTGLASLESTSLGAGQGANTVWCELTETATFTDNGTKLLLRRTNTIDADYFDMLLERGSSSFTTAVLATKPGGTKIPWTQVAFPATWQPVEITAAQIASTSNATTYASPSWTPVANRLYLMGVVHSDAAPEATVPTVTDTHGLTWVQVGSSLPFNTIASNVHRLTVFRAMKASGLSTGTHTVTFGDGATGCIAQVLEIPNVLTTGADGADAVLVLASNNSDATANPSLTMGAYAAGHNTLAMFVATEATGAVAGTGFTGSTNPSYATPSTALFAQWRQGAPETGSVTLASGDWAAMALEVVTNAPPTTMKWLSPRIQSAGYVTVAGSFQAWLYGLESNALANVKVLAEVYHVDRGTSGETLVWSLASTELGTVSGTINISGAATVHSTKAFLEDDRIALRLFGVNNGTMAGAYTATLNYDHNVVDTSGDAYLRVWDAPVFKGESDPVRSDIVPSGGAMMGVSNGQ